MRVWACDALKYELNVDIWGQLSEKDCIQLSPIIFTGIRTEMVY